MTRELTVKEYALVERVTPRTVWRWIDKGALQVRRTPGGGVRVLILGAKEVRQMMTSEDDRGHPSR